MLSRVDVNKDKLIMKVAVYQSTDGNNCCGKCDLEFAYCAAECNAFDESGSCKTYLKIIDDEE